MSDTAYLSIMAAVGKLDALLRPKRTTASFFLLLARRCFP